MPLSLNNAVSSIRSSSVASRITGNNAYLSALSAINWSRSYKWRVELEDVPAPFNPTGPIGLPVINVTDMIGFGNTFDLEQGISWMRVPSHRGRYEIVMQTFDDDNGTIENFIEDWFNSVYDTEQGIAYVMDAAKELKIKKLNSMDQVIVDRSYFVYPYQSVRGYNQQDDSNPRRYELTFIIVSYNNKQDGNGVISHASNLISTVDTTVSGNFGNSIFNNDFDIG